MSTCTLLSASDLKVAKIHMLGGMRMDRWEKGRRQGLDGQSRERSPSLCRAKLCPRICEIAVLPEN